MEAERSGAESPEAERPEPAGVDGVCSEEASAAPAPPSLLRQPVAAGGGSVRHLLEAGAAPGASRSPVSRRLARSPSEPAVQPPALAGGAASEDPRVLLAIIETFHKDKASLDSKVNSLLQERRSLEKENAEHRAANLEKDRQIARLLARAHKEEPKRAGVGSAPPPARSQPSRLTPRGSPHASPRLSVR